MDFTMIDSWFGVMNAAIAKVLFANILFFTDDYQLPLVLAWLVVGATFFTIRMGFPQFRLFRHAVAVTRGKYDDPNDVGEASHFQALATALSATVGLGNIAGVAIAVSVGGPGATFWMIVAGLLGMCAKFVECTLGQMYREVRSDGHVMGGAMEYLSRGFKEKGWPRLGAGLAVVFSVLCIGGSFGGGNAFQVNQSLNAVAETIPFLVEHRWVYGLIMAALVGVVIIGGIRRIVHVTDKIVPFMCGFYVLVCLAIIGMNLADLPAALGAIWTGAFTPAAGYGGVLGVLVQGFRRAAFSNEAGLGSAAIAHAAARSKYPVREGIVALLEPFIDTVVVCTMTAVVIVITGAYNAPEYESIRQAAQGATLTSRAFGGVVSWLPYFLSVAVILFAYSTMISWSYYGERCFTYLFGERFSMAYRWIYVAVVFLGAVTSSLNVLDFSDLMILAMGLPNIIGLYVLQGHVRRALVDYVAKLKSGELEREIPAAASNGT